MKSEKIKSDEHLKKFNELKIQSELEDKEKERIWSMVNEGKSELEKSKTEINMLQDTIT